MCGKLAGVNGQEENLRQSVAPESLNAPQIFFLTVHFCMKSSRMWQGFMCCLFRQEITI
jgi:hypothetical protein